MAARLSLCSMTTPTARRRPLNKPAVLVDEVLLIFGPLGTAPNSAIQKYMNEKKVPQLFVQTGATKWNAQSSFLGRWAGHPITRAKVSFQSGPNKYRRRPTILCGRIACPIARWRGTMLTFLWHPQ